MSPNQDKRKEESPSAGDYPETQPSEPSTTNSNRATQGSGSHGSPPTPSSQTASPDGHFDLAALAEEPASDAVQNWPLDERPAPVDAVPVMEARIALMMASYEGHGAVGAPVNDAVTKADPTPPSDG